MKEKNKLLEKDKNKHNLSGIGNFVNDNSGAIIGNNKIVMVSHEKQIGISQVLNEINNLKINDNNVVNALEKVKLELKYILKWFFLFFLFFFILV